MAGVLNEQEHSSIKQKARTSLQARELIDTVLVKGSSAVTIFKNSLQEIDPMLYKRFFGECFAISLGNFLGQLKICS